MSMIKWNTLLIINPPLQVHLLIFLLTAGLTTKRCKSFHFSQELSLHTTILNNNSLLYSANQYSISKLHHLQVFRQPFVHQPSTARHYRYHSFIFGSPHSLYLPGELLAFPLLGNVGCFHIPVIWVIIIIIIVLLLLLLFSLCTCLLWNVIL